MMNEQKIPFPTEEEKNRSISFIVTQAKPQQQRFLGSIGEMLHCIGFRGLFFGVEDCVFLALLCTVFGIGGTVFCAMEHQMLTAVLLFAASPFLYGLLQVLTMWKELMTGIYEQKMVYRYTLRQVNLARMLMFGGVSLIICIGVSLLLVALGNDTASMLRLLGISFASLFLFATAELFAQWRCSVPVGHFIVPVLWSVLSLVLLLSGSWAEKLLMELPVAVFWVLAAGCAVVYAKMLRYTYFKSQEGAVSYAIS